MIDSRYKGREYFLTKQERIMIDKRTVFKDAKDRKTISVWVDKKIKEDAETIMKRLGFTPTTLINMLYRQIILVKKIPFEVKIDKEEDE